MRKDRIAAQLYTLRDFLKTPSEIATSLRKVKQIGFDAVQVSGLGPIDTKELAGILDSEGLVCCASHDGGDQLFNETEKVAEKLHTLKCKYTAYPWPHTSPKSEADYIDLAKKLDKAGATLKAAGITLCYHNHALEFEKFNGRTGLDIIYSSTNPGNLQGEIDTYWVQCGGCDPVEWCRKLKGRLPIIHFKEYGVFEGQVRMLEIGSGNLNWKAIAKASEEAGSEWFIIEQDICRMDPFDSLKMSLEYLKREIC